MENLKQIPKDGFEGLKQFYKSDSIAGFMVFLIALPLSLGIAKASGFPSIAGIYTAIVGGMVVSLFAGSKVTIKGPAAGLIVIAVGAVNELGNGDLALGYKLALATIVISGGLQILFGLLRAGVLSDFFPHSVVHGMLAAIGIIIISKQIHISLGVIPAGKEALELLEEIPHSILKMNPEVAIIGAISLAILFIKPLIQHPVVKIIPGPLVVLITAIPLGFYFDLEHPHDYHLAGLVYHVDPVQLLVSLPSSFLSGITMPDFSQVFTLPSIKYIIMFALVGSVESLLSAKAIDSIDPYKRQSNMDRDLLAVGIGNVLCGMIGGLPMISEIVRSSANINNGGVTRWANFFHGLFLLLFVVLAASVIQLIPNAALAAMLLYTGFNLASPKEFKNVWKIGPEQLVFFIATIVITITTDLLLGVFFGICVKLFTAAMYGAPLSGFFSVKPKITSEHGVVDMKLYGPGMFTNVIPFKKILKNYEGAEKIRLDFSASPYVDFTFQENLHKMEEIYHSEGKELQITGFDKHHFLSDHPQSIRVKIKNPNFTLPTDELTPRQSLLLLFAQQSGYEFDSTRASTFVKFSLAVFKHTRNCMYGQNMLSGTIHNVPFLALDVLIKEQTGFSADNVTSTVLYINNLDAFQIPNFTLGKEDITVKLKELQGIKDIDFDEFPVFSEKYFLVGQDENETRAFFKEPIIRLFEEMEDIYVEAHSNALLIHTGKKLLNIKEIKQLIQFSDRLLTLLKSK